MSIICARLFLQLLDNVAKITTVNQVRTLYRRFCMKMKNNEQTIHQLCESNPDVKAAWEGLVDENRQVISRFTHELRNPLTLVRSTIQLIEQQHPEVLEYKYWDQLLSDIDDTVNILNDLSYYNQCSKLQLTSTDLIELVQNCANSMEPYAASKQLVIHVLHDEYASLYNDYTCDKIKIKQVIHNLLKNAVEASNPNTTITVSLSLKSSCTTDSSFLQISVTNSGTPIPLEHLEFIFEPFVTYKPNGSGLGLAICRTITKLHQGNLYLSQTDQEITFNLQLPLNGSKIPSLYMAL